VYFDALHTGTYIKWLVSALLKKMSVFFLLLRKRWVYRNLLLL